MTNNIDCVVQNEEVFGEYVNSFRILHDGQDILLDFCIYSQEFQKAKLVSRLRVTPTFLKILLDRVVQVYEDSNFGLLYSLPQEH